MKTRPNNPVMILRMTLMLCAFLFAGLASAFAQDVTGPNPVYVGQSKTYSFTDDGVYLNYDWDVVNGSVSSMWKTGITYYVSVYWNTAGSGKVSFTDNGTTISYLDVTVNTCTSSFTVGGGGVSCSGANVTITLSGSVSGVTYQLKRGA
ncbi:MAG TPA: hypothetical protein VEB86_14775, partial [Chryseosolibacter sp.]|nr:hypothetical protein [Chryseosolibacter sp.]